MQLNDFLDGLIGGGSTNIVDEEQFTVQDSQDKVMFSGKKQECLDWYEYNADWAEHHFLFDYQDRCWEMTPNGLIEC